MSTFDYARAETTAQRLIKRFGQAVTLTKTTDALIAYDPKQTETSYTVQAAQLNYNEKDIDGTLIQTDDRLVYISTEGLAVIPEVDDTLTINSVDLNIISIMPLAPAGTVVYWKVQVRAA